MNQEYSDLLLIFIILILFFLVIYLLFKNKSNSSIQENDSINVQKNISEIQGSIILLTKTVEEKINNINKNIGSSLNEQTEKTQKSSTYFFYDFICVFSKFDFSFETKSINQH